MHDDHSHGSPVQSCHVDDVLGLVAPVEVACIRVNGNIVRLKLIGVLRVVYHLRQLWVVGKKRVNFTVSLYESLATSFLIAMKNQMASPQVTLVCIACRQQIYLHFMIILLSFFFNFLAIFFRNKRTKSTTIIR